MQKKRDGTTHAGRVPSFLCPALPAKTRPSTAESFPLTERRMSRASETVSPPPITVSVKTLTRKSSR